MRIFLLLAVAFVAYTLAWREAPVLDGDSPQYMEVARDLSDGSLDALHDRTIGYPLLLVATGATESPTRALFLASLALHFASVWLLAVVLSRAGASPRRVLAFVVLACLPLYVEPAGYVMTENLAQFTLAAGVACLALWFDRHRWFLLVCAGLGFAASTLTRPANQAVAIAVGACLLVLPRLTSRDRVANRDVRGAAAAIVAVSIVVLGSVALFNRSHFGFLGVTPSLGFHLSTKTTPFLERLPDHYAAAREILIRERDLELVKRGGPHSGTQAIWSVRPQLMEATGLSMVDLSKYLVRMNLALIRRAPLEYLQEVARSLATYWLPFQGRLAAMDISALRWAWALLHLGVVLALALQVMVFGGLALFDASRRTLSAKHRAALAAPVPALAATAYAIAAAVAGYTMLVSCLVDIGEPRQRRATDLIILFVTVLGLHIWKQMAKPGPHARVS